ncbi:MAG: outer membrane protein assembly factor BamA [Hyphomicrobiaceae bacterium]
MRVRNALRFLVLSFFALGGLCGAWQAPLRAESTTAGREITVEGARTLSADEVLARLEAMPPVANDALYADAVISTLMATGLFSDVRVEQRRRAVHIHVAERPVIASVTFSGASEVEKKKLEETVKLKAGGRFTAAKAQADAVSLRELYHRLGRIQTTIEPKSTPRADGRVDVAFSIKEGAVNKIERIDFVGNRAFAAAELRDVITTSQSGWFDILKAAAFYDPERIQADRELVRQYYANHGYPDARVTHVEATLSADKSAYAVTFSIDEGQRLAFGPARIESSIAGVDTNQLQAGNRVEAGNVYSQEKIEKSVEVMSESLARNGHPFARVQPVAHRDRASGRVDMVFRVEAGKPVYVERIEVKGNVRTRDDVIRRELRFSEGDPLNAYAIKAATRRLKRLGFFKSVEIKPEAGSTPDKAKLTVAVVEQETAELSFGGGYSTTEGVIGDIALTERNLFGGGQYLRLKLAGSFTRFQADIGFTEPHFLGTRTSAGFDLFYKDVDNTQQASYKSLKAGGVLRLGYPISDELTASVNYTFVRSKLYDVGDNASTAVREALGNSADGTATYNTSSVGYGTIYDTRDSKRMPTSGVSFTLSQDLAGVGGDVQYLRSTSDVRGYYPVNDSITLAGRVRGGLIEGWGGQDVRLLDLFYKGGDLVRGFETAGIGPRDTLSANKDALGGRMYVGTTAETLFDIPGVPKDLGVRASVFADAGSLWGTNTTGASVPGLAGNTATPRASAGVGIVWDSPLGPLRADYAVPLVAQPFDKLQPFSFGMAGF